MFCAFNLTASLASLKTADTAVTTFLSALDLDGNGKIDMTKAPAGDGVDQATEAAAVKSLIDELGGVNDPIVVFNTNAFSSSNLTSASTAAEKASAFAAARANAQNAVDNQQKIVDADQKAVDALNDATDVAAYSAALTAATASQKALDAANLSLVEATTVFALANHAGLTVTVTNSGANVDTDTTVTYDDDNSGVTPEVDLIVWDSTAKVFKLDSAVTDAAIGKAADSDEAKLVVEAGKVLAAVQAAYNAQVADTKADAAVITTSSKVGNGTTDVSLVDTLASDKLTLADKVKDQATLETEITKLTDAYAKNAQLDGLEKTASNALTALHDADWNAVTLTAGVDANSDIYSNDAFIFGGKSVAIANFGAVGDDLIAFDAGKYTVTKVASGDWLSKAVGSATALEIFVVETGGNTHLYVEQNAFDGSTAAAQVNALDIQLTGITGATVALDAQGYLTVA